MSLPPPPSCPACGCPSRRLGRRRVARFLATTLILIATAPIWCWLTEGYAYAIRATRAHIPLSLALAITLTSISAAIIVYAINTTNPGGKNQ